MDERREVVKREINKMTVAMAIRSLQAKLYERYNLMIANMVATGYSAEEAKAIVDEAMNMNAEHISKDFESSGKAEEQVETVRKANIIFEELFGGLHL